jgi:hypothetical protein
LLRSPLAHFLFLGIALFALRAVWNSAPEASAIEIRRSEIDASIVDFERGVGRAASEDEVQAIRRQIVENALWLEQAWALGLHEVDPVVRRRLVQNMRFLETDLDLSESGLVERAIELGLDKSDPVIRRRLIDRVQALLRAGVRSRTPNETTLRSHYHENADRWRTPPLLDLSHVYLSRDKRGSATKEDAIALLRVLVGEGLSPESGIRRGDSFLAGHRLSLATRARIVARLGPEFADGLAGAPTQRWFGPVVSAFGSHLVWIHERIENQLPEFEEVRTRVLEDWFEEEVRRAIRSEITRHRQRVEVRILEDVVPNKS